MQNGQGLHIRYAIGIEKTMLEYPNIFIIGGTGFIGYHAVRLLLARGYHISTLSLPPLPAEGLFPVEVGITLADMNALSDSEIVKLFAGQDILIFAAGADDRTTPKKPAWRPLSLVLI